MKLDARIALPKSVQPNLCGMMEPQSPTAKIVRRAVVNRALMRRPLVSKRAARRSIWSRCRSRPDFDRNEMVGFTIVLTILGV